MNQHMTRVEIELTIVMVILLTKIKIVKIIKTKEAQ